MNSHQKLYVHYIMSVVVDSSSGSSVLASVDSGLVRPKHLALSFDHTLVSFGASMMLQFG